MTDPKCLGCHGCCSVWHEELDDVRAELAETRAARDHATRALAETVAATMQGLARYRAALDSLAEENMMTGYDGRDYCAWCGHVEGGHYEVACPTSIARRARAGGDGR